MRLTAKQLRERDYDILFTRDPEAFIESLTLELLMARNMPDEKETLARMQLVMRKWLTYFEQSVKKDSFKQGQIQALCNLPVKNGLLGKSVDMGALTEQLRGLRRD